MYQFVAYVSTVAFKGQEARPPPRTYQPENLWRELNLQPFHESACHQMDHLMDHLDEHLAAGGRHLVALARSAASAQPGERPLHHPATRQHDEPPSAIAPLNDLQAQSPARSQRADSRDESTRVVAVGPDQRQPLDHELGPVAVLHVGRVDGTTDSTRPSESTMCRLRPLTFLPAS